MSGKASRHFMGDVFSHTQRRDIWGMQAAESVPPESKIWDQVSRLHQETEAKLAALEVTGQPVEAELCLDALSQVIDLTDRRPEPVASPYL